MNFPNDLFALLVSWIGIPGAVILLGFLIARALH
jgi:hypothetical protein